MRTFLAAFLILALAGYVVSVESRIAQIERHFMDSGYLYHTHYSAPLPGTTAPVRRDVTTKRNTGESVADWQARHAAAVATALDLYPPV